MSKSNTFENDFLLLVFNNTNIANVGDAGGIQGSTTPGSLYFSLHTGNPDEAGDQTTNECAYTSYAREAVARSGAGFTVTTNSVATASDVTFTAATGGTETATHWGIGAASSAAGKLLFYGQLNPTISISNGVTPKINAGTCVTEN